MVDKSRGKRARGAAFVALFVVLVTVSVVLAATGVHGVVRVLVSLVLAAVAAFVTYRLMARRR